MNPFEFALHVAGITIGVVAFIIFAVLVQEIVIMIFDRLEEK